MADAATVVMKTTVLPDEIAKTIEATTTVSPKDANDKWYYKLTSVSASSTDLMAGSFIDYTAVDDDTAPTAIATGDKVEFLYIKIVIQLIIFMLFLMQGQQLQQQMMQLKLVPMSLSLQDCPTQQLRTFTRLVMMVQATRLQHA